MQEDRDSKGIYGAEQQLSGSGGSPTAWAGTDEDARNTKSSAGENHVSNITSLAYNTVILLILIFLLQIAEISYSSEDM